MRNRLRGSCQRTLAANPAMPRRVLSRGGQVGSVGRRSQGGSTMKWVGLYLVGFIVLSGGVLAALWKLGLLANIEPTWIVIGVMIVLGLGIMLSVSQSGRKESIEIDRK